MRYLVLLPCLFLMSISVKAQEFEGPLPSHASHHQNPASYSQKSTAITLPFFDDFTNYGGYPNENLWIGQQVYINNTMASGIKSRGCATFDAFNEFGIPYDSLSPFTQVNGDSLSSKPIDLSSYSPSDSLYLSFMFQAKGWGFAPKPDDSLQLFFLRENGSWQKMWTASASDYTDFKFALVPLTDTLFYSSNFQFRFVNKATAGISNSNWNLDYVLLDKDRSVQDSTMQDIAFTKNPGNLLNDFSAMPYRHFKTNPSSFLKINTEAYLRNNGNQSASLNYGLTSKEIISGMIIGNSLGNSIVGSQQENSINFPCPDIAQMPLSNVNEQYIFENKYFVSSFYPNEPVENDTIIQRQVFDNYFAYDDGSAEQVYFLNLFPNAPGKFAVEYALYTPDTLRGISIYLPRQVPSGINKEFSLAIYKSIAMNGQQDNLIYQQSFLFPEYQDSINQFTNYIFDEPLLLSEGTFYVALIQAAGGGSDSLYIGLDKNREGANHRYFNVDGIWQNSTIDGAVMIRPLVGKPIPRSGIQSVPERQFSIFPNPVQDLLTIKSTSIQSGSFSIVNVHGKQMIKGKFTGSGTIQVENLIPGIYFLQLKSGSGHSQTLKFVKQ